MTHYTVLMPSQREVRVAHLARSSLSITVNEKRKGLRAVWTPQGFQLKSEHVTTTASQSNNIAYDSNVSLPSSERIRNLVPRLFHLPAPWRIRRSPDGRLALETFCALRGNFSADPMLITTPTRSQLSFAKAQRNTNLSTEQLWISPDMFLLSGAYNVTVWYRFFMRLCRTLQIPKGDQDALTVITYTGLSLSIATEILTIVAFVLYTWVHLYTWVRHIEPHEYMWAQRGNREGTNQAISAK